MDDWLEEASVNVHRALNENCETLEQRAKVLAKVLRDLGITSHRITAPDETRFVSNGEEP